MEGSLPCKDQTIHEYTYTQYHKRMNTASSNECCLASHQTIIRPPVSLMWSKQSGWQVTRQQQLQTPQHTGCRQTHRNTVGNAHRFRHAL